MGHLLNVDIEVQEASTIPMVCGEAVVNCFPTPSRSSVRHETTKEFASKVEFDDADIDDELDPAMEEELDR